MSRLARARAALVRHLEEAPQPGSPGNEQ
jgi:hypothetical protein